MTAYFDDAALSLDKLFPVADWSLLPHLAWEQQLQQDVLLFAMHPKVPTQIRDLILATVDKYSVWARVYPTDEPTDWESEVALHQALRMECECLHTAMHSAAHWARENDAHFRDDPRWAVRDILDDADELRHQLRNRVKA